MQSTCSVDIPQLLQTLEILEYKGQESQNHSNISAYSLNDRDVFFMITEDLQVFVAGLDPANITQSQTPGVEHGLNMKVRL